MEDRKNINIEDLFLESKDNMIFSANGDYIFAFSMKLPPRYSISKEQILKLHDAWINAVKYLPVDTFIVKSDVYKSMLFDENMGSNSFVAKENTKYFKGKPYLDHKSYVFVIFPSNAIRSKLMTNPFALKDVMFSQRTDIDVICDKAEEFRRALCSELVEVEKITLDEVKKYSLGWWNALQYDFTSDIICKDDHIKVADKMCGIVALTSEKDFKEELDAVVVDDIMSKESSDFVFFKGAADNLGLSLNFDHIYNQIIRIEDKQKVLDKVTKTRNNLNSLKKLSYLNEIAVKQLDEYLKELTERDQSRLGFAYGHTNVIFFADNQNEFVNRRNIIKDELKQIATTPYIPQGKRLQNLFYNTFFSNIACLDEDSLYLVTYDIAAVQMINNSNYHSDEYGVWFQDRIFQKPFKFDMWDDKLKRVNSRNGIIFSPTGNGKSVLANVMENGLLDIEYPVYDIDGNVIGREGVVMVNIDLGRSYEKLSMLYPKEDTVYFCYKPGQPLGLNPFLVINGVKPNELQIESLTEIIWLVIREGKEVLNTEASSLREIIEAYYNLMIATGQQRECSWKTFYEFVEKGSNPPKGQKTLIEILNIKPEYFNIDEFLHVGRQYTTGVYKHVFAANEELTKSFIGKRFINFELGGIEDNHLLLSIVLQIIYTVINQVIWNNDKKGIVLMDEFAQLLKFGDIFSRVAYYCQAIRKQQGSVWLILQTVGQLPNNTDGANIIANSEKIICLPTEKTQVILDIVERCGLSKHQHTMIRSLKHNFTGKRPYSEFFMLAGKEALVARIELPPKVLAVYQTNREDTSLLMKQVAKCNGDMELAIEQYIEVKQKIAN